MDIIKRTQIAQDYLRDNVALNLLSRCWKLILADSKCLICSLKLDFHSPETYFVFLFNDMDNITKIGKGLLEGDIIKLEEIKFEWLNQEKSSASDKEN